MTRCENIFIYLCLTLFTLSFASSCIYLGYKIGACLA